MKRVASILILTVCVLCMIGCWPKRVVWSPDGSQAIVIGGDDGALFLCDPQGTLSEKIADGVQHAVWFHDGKRFVIVQRDEVDNWTELAEQLPEDELDDLKAASEKLRSSWSSMMGWSMTSVERYSSNQVSAMKLYLRDGSRGELPEQMRAKLDEVKDNVDVWSMRIVTLGDLLEVNNKPLLSSASTINEPRISPDDEVIACMQGDPFDGSMNDDDTPIRMLLLDPAMVKPARVVANYTSLYPDWTADSRSLVYADLSSVTDMDDMGLGTIRKVRVRDEQGSVLPEFNVNDELAGALVSVLARVRCLKDGRIIFSTLEVQLPAVSGDIPEYYQLFMLDLERQATITRLVPRSEEYRLEHWSMLFEVSPDESQIVLLGDDGQINVLDIRKGTIEAVQPEKDQEVIRTVPTWRYPDQLCFTRPIKQDEQKAASNLDAEVVLYKDGEYQVISAGWPEQVTKDFLD